MGDSRDQSIGSGKTPYNKLHSSDNVIQADAASGSGVELKVTGSKINCGGGGAFSEGISFRKL